MKEQLITFDFFRELESKGFPRLVYMPTLSLVQKWFREAHNIHINPIHHPTSQTYGYVISGKYESENGGRLLNEIYKKYESYEESLEKGLIESLKLLK